MNPLIRRIIGESIDENAVIRKQRSEDYSVCPHCHKEIYEKSTYSEDGGATMRHNCGGVVEFPSAPPPKGFVIGDTTGTSL